MCLFFVHTVNATTAKTQCMCQAIVEYTWAPGTPSNSQGAVAGYCTMEMMLNDAFILLLSLNAKKKNIYILLIIKCDLVVWCSSKVAH